MFRNQGGLYAEAEATTKRIKGASNKEVATAKERRADLRDALNSFGMRLQDLPERERNAALCMLYKRITCIVFDLHLPLQTSTSRAKITSATTKKEKDEAFHEFILQIEDLMMLYDIK